MASDPPVRIAVQARLASRRLPAKTLLPINGIPYAALVALRAGRGGREVVVAVPDGAEDDVLARALAGYGLGVFRGANADVLGRYAAAIEGLPDEAAVVRLTADNVLPDADFIEIMLANFFDWGAPYLFNSSPRDGLPLGLAAPVIRAGLLREAARRATKPYQREHVVPWLKRAKRGKLFEGLKDVGLGGVRCTLDTLDDYVLIARLFEGVADPVGITWRDLCARLARMEGR